MTGCRPKFIRRGLIAGLGLVWGARDPLLPPAAATVLAGYLTHAQVSTVFMPDVGHFPPIEVPDRFARLVAAYLDGALAAPP